MSRQTQTNTLIVLYVLHQTLNNLKVLSYPVVDTLIGMVNMSRGQQLPGYCVLPLYCSITLFTPIPSDETQTPGQYDPFTPHPSPFYPSNAPMLDNGNRTNRSKFVDLSLASALPSHILFLWLAVSLFLFSGGEFFLLNFEINTFSI